MEEPMEVDVDPNKHWKIIGKLLKVDESSLETIEQNYQHDASACKKEMLRIWYAGNPVNPEEKLENAEMQVLKEYHKLESAAPVCFKKIENEDIETRINELKKKFAEISTETLQWLKSKYPDAAIALHWVNQILQESNDKSEPSAIEGTAENYSELSSLLLKNFRYTSPEFLRQLLELAGNEYLKRKMDDYMKEFEEFCRNFVPLERTHFDCLDPCKPRLILIFESGTNLEVIMTCISSIFGINKRYMILCMAEVGSVIVTLQFPPSMQHLIEECIKLHQKRSTHVKQKDLISIAIKKAEIHRQLVKFKREFRDILTETVEWLKDRYPDVQQAKKLVNGNTIGRSGTPLTIEGDIKDYDMFDEALRKQWRYTRPDKLAQLIRKEGTDDLKSRMCEYKRKFDEFKKTFKLTRTTIFDDLDETNPHLIIIFKTGTSLDNIEVFLEDVFSTYTCHLHYQSLRIEISRVKVFLQFPASMRILIQECIDFYNKQQKEVEQNKIVMYIEPSEKNWFIRFSPERKTLPICTGRKDMNRRSLRAMRHINV